MSKSLLQETNQSDNQLPKKARIKNADGPIYPQSPIAPTTPPQPSTLSLQTPTVLSFIYENAANFFNSQQYDKTIILLEDLFRYSPTVLEEKFFSLFGKAHYELSQKNQIDTPLYQKIPSTAESSPVHETSPYDITTLTDSSTLYNALDTFPALEILHPSPQQLLSSEPNSLEASTPPIVPYTLPTEETQKLSPSLTTLPTTPLTPTQPFLFNKKNYDKSKKLYDEKKFPDVIAYLEKKINFAQGNIQFDKISFKCIELLVNACFLAHDATEPSMACLLKKSQNYLNFLLDNTKHSDFLNETLKIIEFFDNRESIETKMQKKMLGALPQKHKPHYKLKFLETTKVLASKNDSQEITKTTIKQNVIESTTQSNQETFSMPINMITEADTTASVLVSPNIISFELPSTPSMYFFDEEINF